MANTMTLIASSTVGSGGAASISFSSIPSTYTDLCVKISARMDTAAANVSYLKVRFNAATTNYADRTVFGSGAVAGSVFNIIGDQTGIYWLAIPAAASTSSVFGNADVYVPNYNSANYKSVSIDSVSENNGTTTYAFLVAGLWQSTSAITSINLVPDAGALVQYSTFYLYGVKNA
jgi:hypothetical protein